MTSFRLYSDLPAALEIRSDEGKGRGIWSSNNLKRGTVLLAQRPRVSVLSTLNLPSHCSYCTSASSSRNGGLLKRCTKCKTIFYCSSECQSNDWSFHKHECVAIRNWISSAPNGSLPGEAVRSLGRILWGRMVEGEESAWWREIDALQSHRTSLPPSAIESHTQLAHALVRYLGVTSPIELEPYGLRSSSDLVDLISRFTTNTFTLTTPSLSPLGTCVSPIAALFNHTCLPNAVIVFPRPSPSPFGTASPLNEPVLTVVAIKDISAGEEVLTAYIDLSLPTLQRQKTLKETYNFTCVCPLCTGLTYLEPDPRETLWCPRACGGMCRAPSGKDNSGIVPHCTKCKAGFTSSVLADIEDQIRIGQEALDKATTLQFSEPASALNLTSHILPLLSKHLPPSSHPLLALLRLHQSLLITSLTPNPAMLDDTIRTTARAVSGLTSVLIEGHPVRGIALAELGKLLAVDEHPSSAHASPSSSNSGATQAFPPLGVARLTLAVETLQRARKELMIGFGEDTGGGDLGRDVREEIVKLEREMNVWNRGARNASVFRGETGARTS